MITNLHIKNIGIIDELDINLSEGFNVFTGETGAGKSLIIDSLAIICGGRFNKEMIRKGESQSFVEMSLYLPNQGYEDDMVIVSREINLNGRNMCKINGRMVTCTELKEFMENIIDIHGQSDNQIILNVNSHVKFLDGYAGEDIKSSIDNYKELYSQYLDINKKLNDNYGNDREKERKLDLLRYEVAEIEKANLQIGEDEELDNKRQLIMSSEKISNSLKESNSFISEQAIDSVNQAIRSLERIENLDTKYVDLVQELKSSYYELQEASYDINDYLSDVDFDEQEQKDIEDRYDFIRSLKRKYGSTIEEILQYKEQKQNEITQIENLDDYIQELKLERKDLAAKMYTEAQKINDIRIKYANKLQKAINKELCDLEMNNSSFKVQVDLLKDNEFNKNGQNKVEFMISTNVGEDYKPLVKIASGGEMSRIMLAIKNVLSDVDKVPVLVFDEIDTGISGYAANSVGEKMKQISNKHQVICVTHQASIAAKGDYNYYISKSVKDSKTSTQIKRLNEQEVINEIARIASGSLSITALNHARELRCNRLKLVG